ncbi:hypothetical protein ACLOJK_003460 [Asimina triloba]
MVFDFQSDEEHEQIRMLLDDKDSGNSTSLQDLFAPIPINTNPGSFAFQDVSPDSKSAATSEENGAEEDDLW